MKLLFLGTGAADWPRDRAGVAPDDRRTRRYSSAMTDGGLLIDPGPHIYDYAERLGTPGMFRGIRAVAVTHSHHDHLDRRNLLRLAEEADRAIDVFADAGVFRRLGELPPGLVPHEVKPGAAEETDGYVLMPCRSNHDLYFTGEQTLNWIVTEKSSGRSFFYGADSGWIMYDTWQLIRKAKPNAVVFEATLGDVPGDDRVFGHTSVPMIAIMLETMRKQKGIADGAKIITTHMARTLHGTHEETAALLAPLGAVPAYDGFETEI